MKITKSKLKQIIKEEMEESWRPGEFNDKEEAVRVMAEELVEAIREMGNSNPELTDHYIMIMRALRDAGVSIEALVQMS
jgi:20S proteasome alpha/beta subunit